MEKIFHITPAPDGFALASIPAAHDIHCDTVTVSPNQIIDSFYSDSRTRSEGEHEAQGKRASEATPGGNQVWTNSDDRLWKWQYG